MAGHYKKEGYKPTTSISLDETLFEQIDNFRFKKRFDSRSQAIAVLIAKGLKYEAIVEKKKAAKVI
ncbi:MAG: ribbon-helix-helix domain-containing protein [Bacillota bacterium]|nr:ribbon-helix-helix domain-containing protein [Bacillota bacterium]